MRPHRDDRSGWSPHLGAAVVALLLAIAFAVLAQEASERELLKGDQAVHDIVGGWRSPALDGPMQTASALGSGTVLIPLNIALGVALWRRRYRHPLMIPMLTLGAVATEALFKWLVHRPRPKAVGYGFPSGHVMASIVFFGLVLFLLWRGRHGDGIACLAAAVGIVIVAAIGVSRIYLHAHWLSDVLGGGAAGLAFLLFAVVRLEPWLTAREPVTAPPPRGRQAPLLSAGSLFAGGVALLALVDVGTRTFATNDEARFPVLAQGLLAGGDWLVPSLNGAPYLNKPPLLAWVVAAVSWPFGHVTQVTAVLPSVLGGLLTVFVVYRLGRELWNPTAGRYAAAIAATTQGLFIHARLAMPDMLMTTFITLSIWALHRMRRRPEGPAWLMFYGAVAAAFWTKGPAGLIPLAVAAAYAVAQRHRQSPRWLRLPQGLLLLGALLLPWMLAAALQKTADVRHTVAVDYLAWYVPQRLSIATLVTPVLHAASMMFPWLWLIPFALYDAWRHRSGRGTERDAVVLVLIWAVAVFALVSFSGQQRVRYYVPLVPPLALVLGWWLATAVVARRPLTLWPLRWTATLCGAALITAGAWSVAQGRALRGVLAAVPSSAWQAVLIVAAGVTVVAGIEVGLRTGRLRRVFPVAVVAAAVLVVGTYHAEQTRRNAEADYIGLARLIQQTRVAHERVGVIGIPALPVAFYLGERVTELTPAAAASADTRVLVVNAATLRAVSERTDVSIAARSASARWRHLAFEVLCLVIALAAIVARSYAAGQGASRGVVALTEAVVIVALASFPAHRLVFAGGVVAAAAWGYVRWRRPAVATSPQLMAGALLVLALPLDVLDDLLGGSNIKADPVWMLSALVGVALITWSRLRGATTVTSA